MKKYRHIFFDLDNTITRSRSLVEPEMEKVLFALQSTHDVIIVSGAERTQICTQIGSTLEKLVYLLAQNGNSARKTNKALLWKHKLMQHEKAEILKHIDVIKRHYQEHFAHVEDGDLIEDRDCQIAFSILGHRADIDEKEACDPDQSIRRNMLQNVPFRSRHVEVRIGGTTCLDYMQRGRHKGYNVQKLIKHAGWNKEDCLYIGDALFAGGNDESVLGVIDTQAVASPKETLQIIQKLL